MLSIIIPAKNEIYLERTIKDILKNARGEIEVLAMLDGYMPDPPINIDDKRVIFWHYDQSIGQRACCNEGAKKAKGNFIMKCDAHCAFDEGFDVKLAETYEPDWTVIPRMYNLDHETWKPKLHKRTDYMYIGCSDGKLLRAEYYGSRQPKNDKMIDDTMCCMGPCWFMSKDRYWELGGMDEGHGGWGQMGVEVALKAWLSGGALKVNKNTWFAHWFRGGSGPGFPYPLSGRAIEKARKYSRDLWLNNKWEKQTRKFEWVIEKFNPPGWAGYIKRDSWSEIDYYRHFISKPEQFPKWMGNTVIKYPSDLMIYQEIIFKNKPDFLVETGTYRGGSAVFFAGVMDLIGHGHVISIDMHDHKPPAHPRITYIQGRTTEKETLDKVRELVGVGSVMASLDSNHHRSHVKRELIRYGAIVTPGQYMVVEDTINHHETKKAGPDEAISWFMKRTKKYKQDPLDERFIFSLCSRGWLRRVK